MKRFAILTATAVLGLLAVTGCAEKATEPYKDSGRGATNNSKADVITFPDGFNNVSTKCDHGNRIYVTYHADSPYGAVAVVPNAKGC
jgi:hypothetical protein